jgi:hypothetical protein
MIFFSLAETGVTPQAPVLTIPGDQDDRGRCISEHCDPTRGDAGVDGKRGRRDHEDRRHLEGANMHDVVGEFACEGQ